MTFNPYHRWLGIPLAQQPADHYRLLGIERFEPDAEVVAGAAERQISHVRKYALGEHADACQEILNELARAKTVLLDEEARAAYDAKLVEAETPQVEPVAAPQWFVLGVSGEEGPYDWPTMEQFVQAGRIAATTGVRSAAETEWKSAGVSFPNYFAVPLQPAPAMVSADEFTMEPLPIAPAVAAPLRSTWQSKKPRPPGLMQPWVRYGIISGIGVMAIAIVGVTLALVLPKGEVAAVPESGIDSPPLTGSVPVEPVLSENIDDASGGRSSPASDAGDNDLPLPPQPAIGLEPIADQEIDEMTPLELSVKATGSQIFGSQLAYSLAGDVPEDCKIDEESGVITWTPTEEQGPGQYTIRVQVKIVGEPFDHGETELRVNVREVNRPPVVAALEDRSLQLGGKLSFKIMAVDSDNDKLTFSLQDGPSTATVDRDSGMLSWTPQLTEIGTHQFTIEVQENTTSNATVRESFVVKITSPFGELKLGKKFTNSLNQQFVYLPAGTFEMGSPLSEKGRSDDEGKSGTHTVELTEGFFMAIHETTQDGYETITGQTPWKGKQEVREGANYPATYVSWDDAQDFLKKLNAKERAAGTLPAGWEYRLPTEAQWEYAARAGTTTRFSFGDDESTLGDYAWHRDNAYSKGEQYAHRVGLKKPNRWGLYDMMGNCWEWTYDDYQTYPSGKVKNPLVDIGGSNRVLRGGSWYFRPAYCRVAFRYRSALGFRSFNLGFRSALVQLNQPSQQSGG